MDVPDQTPNSDGLQGTSDGSTLIAMASNLLEMKMAFDDFLMAFDQAQTLGLDFRDVVPLVGGHWSTGQVFHSFFGSS